MEKMRPFHTMIEDIILEMAYMKCFVCTKGVYSNLMRISGVWNGVQRHSSAFTLYHSTAQRNGTAARPIKPNGRWNRILADYARPRSAKPFVSERDEADFDRLLHKLIQTSPTANKRNDRRHHPRHSLASVRY